MALKPLDRVQRIVTDNGRAEMVLQIFSQDVSDSISHLTPIIGSGNPEGIVKARAGKTFFDKDGPPGSRRYFKQEDSIGGDQSLGWVLE